MTRVRSRPRNAGGAPGGTPRQIRIVGGRWKRSVLPVPDIANLRPTPDRVRETLFNWLGQTLEGLTVLDLFAGTGALGFEAASRGAREVTLVEADPRACRLLQATRDRLAAVMVEIVRDDASRWLDRARLQGRRFDLILLDPPFGQDWVPGLLPRVREVLADGGRLYVELPGALAEGRPDEDGWQVVRAGRAGQVHYHLLVADDATDRPDRIPDPR